MVSKNQSWRISALTSSMPSNTINVFYDIADFADDFDDEDLK